MFSHALIVPLNEITRISDLRPLLEILTVDDRSRPTAETIDLPRIERHLPGSCDLPEPCDLLDAAEALVSAEKLPTVRAGHSGFDDLVVALWARLLPRMRRNFAFRLSFSPDDLVEDLTPALVCTPHTMVGQWTGYCVIRSGAVEEPTSLASAVLSSRRNIASLLEFRSEIGADPETFIDLRLLDQAYQFSIKQQTLENCIGAMRLIGKLSPDSRVGQDRKDSLIRQLMEVIVEANAEDILLMRNLQLSAFPSPNRVWQKLKVWAMENVYSHDQDHHMILVLQDAISDDSVSEWRTAFLDGLTEAARVCEPDLTVAFWRWVQICPNAVDSAFRGVMTEADVERCVAEAAPRSISEEIAEILLALARSRGWLRVHGVVLSSKCKPLDSVRQQIVVDTDLSFTEGVRFSLRNAKQKEILDCALEIGEPRIIALAGEAVTKHPNLLSSIDFSKPTAQEIWQEALATDPDSWQGLVNPEAAIYVVLDCLLDGGRVNSSLVDRLSLTPIADLGGYPRRAEVWRHVDSFARGNFLAATAKGWLKHAANNHMPFKPESELQSAIFAADALESILNGLFPDNLSTAIWIISALDRYDENRFIHLIHSMIADSFPLSVSDAERIGHLILNRQWKRTAENLVKQYQSGRKDLKPILRTCYDMLSRWTRISLKLKPLSEDEKWDAFEDLVTELYPSGPNEKGMWERAGGNDSDLLLHQNGRTQWRKALRNVRRGAGVRPVDILNSMKEDFPTNKRISDLSNDPMFEEDA